MVDAALLGLFASACAILGAFFVLRWLDAHNGPTPDGSPADAPRAVETKNELTTISVPFERVTERLYFVNGGEPLEVTHDRIENATVQKGERAMQHAVHNAFATPRRAENAGIVTERFYTAVGGVYGYGPTQIGRSPYVEVEPTKHAVLVGHITRRRDLEAYAGEVRIPVIKVTKRYGNGATDTQVRQRTTDDVEIEIHD